MKIMIVYIVSRALSLSVLGNNDQRSGCVPGVVEQWMRYINHLVFWDNDGPS